MLQVNFVINAGGITCQTDVCPKKLRILLQLLRAISIMPNHKLGWQSHEVHHLLTLKNWLSDDLETKSDQMQLSFQVYTFIKHLKKSTYATLLFSKPPNPNITSYITFIEPQTRLWVKQSMQSYSNFNIYTLFVCICLHKFLIMQFLNGCCYR